MQPLKTLSYSASTHKEVSFFCEPHSRRFPTRSKNKNKTTQHNWNTKKLEKKHLPATFNFSEINAVNPPNQLKYIKLIQGKDKKNGCKE